MLHFSGFPGSLRLTRAEAEARELKEQYGAAVLISVNTLFPGTYQYEHREELGLHLYSQDWREFDLGKYKWRMRVGFNNVTGHHNYALVNNNVTSPKFGMLAGEERRGVFFRIRYLGHK